MLALVAAGFLAAPAQVLAGINRIELEYADCVVHERYDTQRGYRGESLTVYDASRQAWHQTWVDTSGLLLWHVHETLSSSCRAEHGFCMRCTRCLA